MKFLSLKLGLTVLSAAACTQKDGGQTKDISGYLDGVPQDHQCGPGESPLSYQLLGTGSKVSPQDTKLSISRSPSDPDRVPQLFFSAQTESDNTGYRFDLCVSDSSDAVYLKRMVERRPTSSPFHRLHVIYQPASEQADPHWNEALAEGASTELQVIFEDAHNLQTLVKGWKTSDGTPFMTVSHFQKGTDPLLVSHENSIVKYGTLVEGSPFDPPKSQPRKRQIKMVGLTIDLDYDLKEIQNGYKFYSVRSIAIKDSSPELKAPIQTFLDGEALTAALEVKATHHSLTDAFIITLEGVRYEIGNGLTITYGNKAPKTIDIGCTQVSACGKDPIEGLPRPM